MKSKLLLALTAALTIGSTSLFAGPGQRDPAPRSRSVRTFTAPVADLKCNTMVINGGGRNGMQAVSCMHYANVRPDDCRRACANK